MKIEDNYPGGKVLWFNDFYLDESRVFFSAGNFNGLYEYLIKENKLNFLGTFKNESILGRQLYGKIHRYKDKLIFTPLSAENIAIYDLKDKTFEAVPLPLPKVPCGFEGKFLNSVMFNNKLFMFPGRFYCIVEYNFDSGDLWIHDDWYDECIKKWEKRSYLLFSYDMVKTGNEVFLPSALNSGIFKYCFNENQYDFINVSYKCKTLSTLAYDGEYFWSATDNGKLLIIKDNGTIIEDIDIYLTYGECGLFNRSIYDNGYLWLFLSQQSKIIKINCCNFKKEFEVIRFSEEEKEYTNLEYHTVNFIERKNNEIFFMARSNRELKYIHNGNIYDYIDNIVDTSGYSEKDVNAIDLYRAHIEYASKENLYFYKKNDIILFERTAFSDTLDFMLEEMNMRGNETIDKCNLNAGRKIHMSCMGKDDIT